MVPTTLFFSCAVLAIANVVGAVPYAAKPKPVVLNPAKLVAAKVRLDAGTASPALKDSLAALTTQADEWLNKGPWAVTNKTITPPGGNIHDYASQAPYWWPSDSADGCPYIQKDGVRNPETERYTDHGERADMFIASYILSLAWWYTGNEAYGRRAGDVLRTWFIDEATRMTPHLDHAQIIPCANTGRAIGIIDFSQGYTSVLDAAALLAAGAPGWSQADAEAFKQWNVQYLDWLENSEFGKTETAAKNNHGPFAIMQSAGIALFVGNTGLAASKAEAMKSRINQYITANGSQPQELVRTRSYHYSVFTLVAYTRVADIGKKVGVDLWGYKGPDGQSIMQAINFVTPAATGAAQWTFPETEFEAYIATDVVHSGADNGNQDAKAALKSIPKPPTGDLWFVRPAVEQLDPA
ncbi:Alginate-lyase domain-containing protein [Mycena indigotica]|uniref:Alginate-lyase domain-containing protein n=1 Tax=Mycena indigotica TaxID=2126181 RepID=A0A8H6TE26_9AGAR|nr:Alginate-lyase domain-containing protein [Mycena indigotica]KAF7315052.1 Alginate-lyase domain-containing protein [Mycena indigotica]